MPRAPRALRPAPSATCAGPAPVSRRRRSGEAHVFAGARRRGASKEAPRKEPRQERARQTVEAILDAAANLIARRGWSATTTNHIAVRAGVSIGSVYQYFPNKTAILVRLLERHIGAVEPVVTEFLARLRDHSLPVEESLRRLFRRLVATHADHPRLNRVLGEEVPHPRSVEKRDRQRAEVIAIEVAGILQSRPDVHLRRPLEAAYVLAQATESLTRWLVHSAPDGLDQEAYIDEAVRMLAGHLRGQ